MGADPGHDRDRHFARISAHGCGQGTGHDRPPFDAVEAKALHLVTQVAEQPELAARALADAILARSPDAVSATKALFHSTRHAAEDQAFDQESSLQFKLLRGRNQGEAMAANMKKREPRFRPRQRDY